MGLESTAAGWRGGGAFRVRGCRGSGHTFRVLATYSFLLVMGLKHFSYLKYRHHRVCLFFFFHAPEASFSDPTFQGRPLPSVGGFPLQFSSFSCVSSWSEILHRGTWRFPLSPRVGKMSTGSLSSASLEVIPQISLAQSPGTGTDPRHQGGLTVYVV